MTPDPLSTFTLRELLDAFSTPDPVPGGGAAAAVAGALGVSLLAMVAALPRTRTGSPDEQQVLAAALPRLARLREALLEAADRDRAAYAQVVAARRLPRSTDAERAARRTAIEIAMQRATEAPLDTMDACRRAIAIAIDVAGCGAPSAASDAAVAVELLRAAVRGAGTSVDANLRMLGDAAYVSRAAERRERLAREAEADADAARSAATSGTPEAQAAEGRPSRRPRPGTTDSPRR